MKNLALALALVAGAAAAQQATMNCRSSASNCSAAAFVSNSTTIVGAVQANLILRDATAATQYALWIDRTASGTRGICLSGNVGTGTCLNLLTVDGTTAASFSAGVNTAGSLNVNGSQMLARSASFTQFSVGSAGTAFFNVDSVGNASALATVSTSAASGTNAFFAATTGAWWKFGAGASDRAKSDGTNVLFDTSVLPVTNDSSTLGTTANAWQTAILARGVDLSNNGTSQSWSTSPISDNTATISRLNYNANANEAVVTTPTRAYNPIGGEKEWAVEKRWLLNDLGFENANCPLAPVSLKSTGAGAVTFSCTDAAAATSTTVSGESYRVLTTTAVSAAVSLVDVSANITKLELGPKYIQRVAVPASTSVRIWVALVPTATSLTSVDTGAISVIGFRYSTAVPDTNWQACTGNATTVTCVDTTVAPSASNTTLEIDCRELTKCRFLINGSLKASQTTSGNLPGSTAQLAPRVLVQTLTTAIKTLNYGRASVQTN